MTPEASSAANNGDRGVRAPTRSGIGGSHSGNVDHGDDQDPGLGVAPAPDRRLLQAELKQLRPEFLDAVMDACGGDDIEIGYVRLNIQAGPFSSARGSPPPSW